MLCNQKLHLLQHRLYQLISWNRRFLMTYRQLFQATYPTSLSLVDGWHTVKIKSDIWEHYGKIIASFLKRIHFQGRVWLESDLGEGGQRVHKNQYPMLFPTLLTFRQHLPSLDTTLYAAGVSTCRNYNLKFYQVYTGRNSYWQNLIFYQIRVSTTLGSNSNLVEFCLQVKPP